MKPLWKYFMFVLGLILVTTGLQADLLVLQDGRRITGFFIKEVNQVIAFRTLEGKEISVPKSEVEKLSLGYTGSPVCFSHKQSSKKKCNSLLYKIKKGKMLIAEGEGFLKLREIPVREVEKVEFQKADSKAEKLTASLPEGMEIELQTKSGNLRGTIQKGTRDTKDTWSIRDGAGNLHKVHQKDIAALVLYPKKPSVFDRNIHWWHIFPGFYQYRQGRKWKGIGIGSGFALALTGVVFEYQASLKAASEGSSDPTVLFFYNDSYKKSFEAHQAREKMYGVVAAFIYAYHVLDYFYLGGYKGYGKKQATGNAQAGFFLENRISRDIFQGSTNFEISGLPMPFPIFSFSSSSVTNPRNPANISMQRIELGFRYNF